ncbi:MAG: hypothetical protein BMS9Abin31_0156 [Gammaproteobacteria bacterium]|nr:MAG: hypothetical protein BMS9Abin31_0156 [Gammaproteobacteria bacterium]
MVNIRTLHFILFSILLLLNNICSASEQLYLLTDKNKSELGRPVRVELVAVSLKEKLSKINLKHLDKHFGVITDYSTADTQDSRWPGQTLQTLNLKLYPRHTGSIVIPGLTLGEFKSEEKTIYVSKGTTGTPQLTLSTNNPFERQLFTVQVTIPVTQSSARLKITADDKISGFESLPLSFKRTKQEDGSYLLQIGWSLSALNNGRQRLELPAINYSVSGVSRKKYYLPIQYINIQKLPAYLPPTIPVGRVTLHSQLSKTGILKTDSIVYWNLQLKGNFISSYQLPPVLRQIKSNDEFKFYPVNSVRKQLVTENNVTASVAHNIPLKILKSGIIKLPKIEVQYFDPVSGKLVNIILQQSNVIGLNLIWIIISYLLIILVSIYIIRLLYGKWKRILYSRQQRNLAMQLLKSTADKKDIRSALKLIANAEYWPENMSLTHWADYWSNKYKTNSSFKQLIKNISQTYYADNNENVDDLNELANKLIDILENRNVIYDFKSNLPLFNL